MRLLKVKHHTSALLGLCSALVLSCLPHLCSAKPSDPSPAQARVFKLDFKKIATSDGTGYIMDTGFVPPNYSSLYWLQPSSGKPHLYSYGLANGKVGDLTSLIPEDELPDAISWSPDGGSFIFADGPNLDLITIKDGTRRVINTGAWNFDTRHIYWMDQGHILSGCDDGSVPRTKTCSCDLATSGVTVLDIKKLAYGLPSVEAYFPRSGMFLSSFFGPDSGSAVFLSRAGVDDLLDAKRIPFPQLNGESSISATIDGKYVVTETNIGNGDTPIVLLIGNTVTGRWARIEPTSPWTRNFHATIAQDGSWLAVDVWPDAISPSGENVDISRLFLAAIPKSLLGYLDMNPSFSND